MKSHFVKTSNYQRFLEFLAAVEGQAPKEGRIINVNGEPGSGKSRTMDHVGADRNAIYINGMPGMTVGYLRDLLAYELGCPGGTRLQQQQAINRAFSERVPMVIFDEAQHGLHKKAECIEFLRCTCEQVGSVLVLVCHTSEKHRFGEHKLAHISTRISAVVEFKQANLADTVLYFNELCDITVDSAVAQLALTQSKGRYRLLANACRTLEDIAQSLGKSALTIDDVKGVLLCEDAMKALRNKVSSHKAGQ
ncbi:MAG: ATP-binding protein [Rhodocyclaceae bacterium]|nr:ATP-binding protein [Rhodocyclaceae bacterium]